MATQPFLAGCSSPDEQAQAYYEKGQALLEAGDYVKAGLEFRNALQIRNKLAPAWYGLARVEEQQGNFEKVYGYLNSAIDADPKYVDALVKRAAILLAARQMDRALAESAAVLELAPDDPDALALRASVLLEAGDRDGAVAQANKAMAKEPGHSGAALVLATERLKAGDAVKALEFTDQGLAKHDDDVGLRVLRMQALERQGRVAEVEQEIRRVIAQHPEKKEYRNGLVAYYLAAGRQEDAERELRAIVATDPADLAAKLHVVRFLNSTKGRDAADAELKAMLEKEPANLELRFAQVDFYLATGRKPVAEQVLQAMIAEQGTGKYGLQARTKLAALRLGEGDKAAAGKLVAEVLAVDARNPDALFMRAAMAIERRAPDDAIADLHTALRDDPNSARVLALLAKAHELAGSLDLAEDSYFRAYQAAPGQSVVGVEYAQFLVKRAKLQRAEEVLEAVVAASPNDVRALTALASVRIALGDGAGAEEVARAISKLGAAEPLSEQVLGAALAAQGKTEESISAFERAQEAAPDAQQPMLALVGAYESAGKYDEAERLLLSVLEVNPTNHIARLRLGQFYMARGKPEMAEQAFREVVTRAPSEVGGYRALAVVYANQGRAGEALEIIGDGLKQKPGDSVLQLTRAAVYQLQKDFDAAITEYEGVLRGDPKSVVAANNLAALLSDRRTDSASLQRALELAKQFETSDVPAFLDTLGWVHYRRGEADQAVAVLKKAAERAPEVAVFRYHLGMALIQKGDKGAAKRELEKALELSAKQPLPQDKEIRETLATL